MNYYKIAYDECSVVDFDTLVEVPNIGYCTFYAFTVCSDLLFHHLTRKPDNLGKVFRFNKDYIVDVFVNRAVVYK